MRIYHRSGPGILYFSWNGKNSCFQIPYEYKQINNVHTVFNVKHDGRHKSQCVAYDHFTDTPVDYILNFPSFSTQLSNE